MSNDFFNLYSLKKSLVIFLGFLKMIKLLVILFIIKLPEIIFSNIFRTLPFIVHLDIFRHIHVLFRHIQSYCGIFTALLTFAYSEPYHVQDPGVFRTWYIFRILSRHNLAYWALRNSRILRTLPYLKPEVHSEPCLFKHI